MNYPRLYRNHVLEWLDEANTWPDATTKEFSFRSYGHISLALHEDNAPFRFELTLHHSFRTDGQMTWCFRNIESALLQIFNNFAVDPATPREYESLQQALDHALELAPVKTLVTFLTPTLDIFRQSSVSSIFYSTEHCLMKNRRLSVILWKKGNILSLSSLASQR